MSCRVCSSSNQMECAAEMNIHFPDSLRNANEIGIFVYPRVLVCLDCGSSSFAIPTPELARLSAADKSLA